MPTLAEIARSHSAALEEAYPKNAKPEALASAIQEIMEAFTVATQDRLYELDNSRTTLKSWIAESSISKQPLAQLEEWLSIVVPALTELGNGSLRNVNQMRQSIQKNDDFLHADTELNDLPIEALGHAFDQVGELAAQARSHYAAWNELHEVIQNAIRERISDPTTEPQSPPASDLPFDQKLQLLDLEACIVLREVTLSQPKIGATISTIEGYLREDHAYLLERLELHLQTLANLDLITQTQDNTWQATWEGHGVANWNEQTSWPGHPLAQPRPGENGRQRAAIPCDEYRPLHSRPGSCWCGHTHRSHASEAVRAAEGLIGKH